MYLRRIAMKNYSVFADAEFNLSTTPDRPVILISANNGGGKTSTLFAFRLALHGRRAFDNPVSESDYFKNIATRFHNQQFSLPCRIELDFDYLDLNKTSRAKLVREWRYTKNRPVESLTMSVDNQILSNSEAEDLLTSIVPPEVARYFFFDAERIKELADWDEDEEAELFQAVHDLLGISLLSQLNRDLQRIQETRVSYQDSERDLSAQLESAIALENAARQKLREERLAARRIRGRYDRALAQIRRLGGMLAEEISEKRERLATLVAERLSLLDEAQRAAHDILPLICGRTLRKTLGVELQRRRLLDDREVVKDFFAENQGLLDVQLRNRGFTLAARKEVLSALEEFVHGKPTPVSFLLPSFSRTEESWMQRVIERELPALEERINGVRIRMHAVEAEIRSLEAAIKSVPDGDPKGDAALAELDTAQRELVEHENRLNTLQSAHASSESACSALQKQDRLRRVASFQSRRLLIREQMLANVIAAIPELQRKLQAAKQSRFAEYLQTSLWQLWHKQDRLTAVSVDFESRSIKLSSAVGLINKRELSAGEKQLFATAFIYALAKLSGKQMPFVIDTPLGRLDQAHRRRFVADFLPEASHQTILLSTDTEIVGSLYADLEPFIAYHYDLSQHNGGVTEEVRVASI